MSDKGIERVCGLSPIDESAATIEYGEEVVRRRDCIYRQENPLLEDVVCAYFGMQLPDRDGFCAWGERGDNHA